MAAKFMKIKELVIPFLTLVVLLSQLSGCAVLSPSEVVEESQKGEEVIIEYADKDNQTDDLTQAISNVQQSETLAPMTNDELIKVFEEAYIGIKVCTADEDLGIDFEYSMIESTAEALYPTKQLPADYKERYIDWRPLDPDTSDNQSGVYEEPSKQPENVPQENTNSNKNTGTSSSGSQNGSSAGTSSSGDNAGGSDAYPSTPLPGAKTPGEGTGWTGPNPQVTLEEGYPNGLPNVY